MTKRLVWKAWMVVDKKGRPADSVANALYDTRRDAEDERRSCSLYWVNESRLPFRVIRVEIRAFLREQGASDE